nr:MFS transporter [Pseudopedobacter sp.]
MESFNKKRIYLKVFFFLSGFLFASWASRIPTIKASLNLNDAELGSLLLVLPISSLLGLPFSGILISKFNTRTPMLGSIVVQAVSLIGIGLAGNIYVLGISLFFFAFAMRISNIAINTQSVNLQKSITKPIIGSFHGLWSVGGIFGTSLTSILLAEEVSIHFHLIMVGIFSLLMSFLSFPHVLKNDKATSGNKIILGKPDPYILCLGLLAFFAAICEGGMYDWSGIYFKEVLKTPIFTYGYLTFVIFMSISRFTSDYIIAKIGYAANYLLSSGLIISGILISIVFPIFWVAIIGFAMTGIGTASMFPMTLSLAGKSEKYSAGMGISIVATYSIFGMLVGPPLIGYISHAFDLRIAFILFALSGLMMSPISQILFKYQAKKNGSN